LREGVEMWRQMNTVNTVVATTGSERKSIPNNWPLLYPNIVKFITWLKDEVEKDGTHPLLIMLRGSDRIRQGDAEYRNHELAQLDSDLAELEGTPGISRVIMKMRNDTEFFDERSVLWFGAKYKRRGSLVEFIPEETTRQTPDIGLVDPKTRLKAVIEVKHLDLIAAVNLVIQAIQGTTSRFVVDIRIQDELLYENQADNLARIIIDKLRDLSASTDGVAPYSQEWPKRWRFDLIPNADGELRPTAVRFVHWGRTLEVPKVRDRLVRVLNKARGQLLDYSPNGINIIAVYVDDSSIKEDIAKEALYKDPGLFVSADYREITALQYVVQRIVPDEELLPNRNNRHFENGNLGSLKL